LICLSHRPKKDLFLKLPESSSVVINLAELPPEEAKELIQYALGDVHLPENILQIILSKAKGNPLFLEEIAIALRHAGTINQDSAISSTAASKQIAKLDVPDRLQTLIMSRLDTLAEREKDIIRTAAVIGNTFIFRLYGKFSRMAWLNLI
jgi:adenylate cyclase